MNVEPVKAKKKNNNTYNYKLKLYKHIPFEKPNASTSKFI